MKKAIFFLVMILATQAVAQVGLSVGLNTYNYHNTVEPMISGTNISLGIRYEFGQGVKKVFQYNFEKNGGKINDGKFVYDTHSICLGVKKYFQDSNASTYFICEFGVTAKKYSNNINTDNDIIKGLSVGPYFELGIAFKKHLQIFGNYNIVTNFRGNGMKKTLYNNGISFGVRFLI